MKDNVCVVTCGAEYGIYIEHSHGLFSVRQDYIYPKTKKCWDGLTKMAEKYLLKEQKGNQHDHFYQTLIDKGLEIVKIFKREINKW